MTPKDLQRPGLIFIPWCAGTSRHERQVGKHVPDSDPGCALQSTSMPVLHRRNVPNCRPMAVGGMRKCSAGACPPLGSGWGVKESAVPIRCTKPQLRLFIPWCAGTSRHERQERKRVPDSDLGQIPARTHDTRNCGSEGPTTRPLLHTCESTPRTPIRCRIPRSRGWDTAKHTLSARLQVWRPRNYHVPR